MERHFITGIYNIIIRVNYTLKIYFLGLGISLAFPVVYSYCTFTLKTLLVMFMIHLKLTPVRNENPKQCIVL